MVHIKPVPASRGWEQKMEKYKKEQRNLTLRAITLVVMAITVFLIAIFYAAPKSEISECLKWQSWTKTYTEFYLTPSEDQQCKDKGINVGATVRR